MTTNGRQTKQSQSTYPLDAKAVQQADPPQTVFIGLAVPRERDWGSGSADMADGELLRPNYSLDARPFGRWTPPETMK